jgi:hypothetical protein
MMMNTTTRVPCDISIEIVGKKQKERALCLLHREMISRDRGCSAVLANRRQKSSLKNIKRDDGSLLRAFVRHEGVCSLSDFFATKFQTLLLSLAHNTTRAIKNKYI